MSIAIASVEPGPCRRICALKTECCKTCGTAKGWCQQCRKQRRRVELKGATASLFRVSHNVTAHRSGSRGLLGMPPSNPRATLPWAGARSPGSKAAASTAATSLHTGLAERVY